MDHCEIKRHELVVQSTCTHYSSFENKGWFGTLKIIGSKIWGAQIKSWTFFLLLRKKRGSLQITSRKNMVQTLKNWVDATLHFLKFQTLKKIKYQGADWLDVYSIVIKWTHFFWYCTPRIGPSYIVIFKNST